MLGELKRRQPKAHSEVTLNFAKNVRDLLNRQPGKSYDIAVSELYRRIKDRHGDIVGFKQFQNKLKIGKNSPHTHVGDDLLIFIAEDFGRTVNELCQKDFDHQYQNWNGISDIQRRSYLAALEEQHSRANPEYVIFGSLPSIAVLPEKVWEHDHARRFADRIAIQQYNGMASYVKARYLGYADRVKPIIRNYVFKTRFEMILGGEGLPPDVAATMLKGLRRQMRDKLVGKRNLFELYLVDDKELAKTHPVLYAELCGTDTLLTVNYTMTSCRKLDGPGVRWTNEASLITVATQKLNYCKDFATVPSSDDFARWEKSIAKRKG